MAAQHSSCRVQHQSRCGIGNTTLDYWCGSGDGGGGLGQARGGVWKRQRYIKNPGFCVQRRLRPDLVLLLVVLMLVLAVEMALLQPLHPLTIRLCGRVWPYRSSGTGAPWAADQGCHLEPLIFVSNELGRTAGNNANDTSWKSPPPPLARLKC